jgi:hypothetical protein
MLYRADLANLVNEAALLAGRSNKELVEKIDFIHAVERSIAVWIFLSMFVQSFSYLKPSYYREKFPVQNASCLRYNLLVSSFLSYFI